MSETIAAISTAMMPAGIGVVRISGDGAIMTAQKIWRSYKKRPISEMTANTAAVGIALEINGGKATEIDECVALVFRSPHSYTGEDVVELSCHGGVYILQSVLEVGNYGRSKACTAG